MAAHEITTIAPGVTRTDCDWGYYLEGAQEALIGAGLATAEWFADGTERNTKGQVVRSKRFQVDGRAVETTTRQRSRICTVRITFSEADQEGRESAKVAAEVRRKLGALPKTAEQYRARTAATFENVIDAIIGMAREPSHGGYRIDADTIAELQRMAGHMVNAVEVAKVVFDRKARTAAEITIKAPMAQADPTFQAFMASATAPEADPTFREFLRGVGGSNPTA